MLATVFVVNAQNENRAKALTFYDQGKGNLDSAKAYIDAACKNKLTATDAYSWYLRGFIYKDKYKKQERSNTKSPLRLESVYSFKKSMNLDTAKEYLKDNLKSLQFLANTFRNDVIESHDSLHVNAPANIINSDNKIALENLRIYKELIAIADPTVSIKKIDIDFNGYFGSFFQQVYEQDLREKINFGDTALVYFKKVLALDPDNYDANFGIGLIYYKKALQLFVDSQYDIDLTELDKKQDEMKSYLFQSLPYMAKANQLDPNNEKAFKGLCIIYRNLNQADKFSQFNCKPE